MDKNCDCCKRCYAILLLKKYLPMELIRTIIIEYDDNHFYIDQIYSENIDKIKHNLNILSMFNKTPTKININITYLHNRKVHEFYSTIIFYDEDIALFVLFINHCDLEFYNAECLNYFLNSYIQNNNILVLTNDDFIYNSEDLIEFPTYD